MGLLGSKVWAFHSWQCMSPKLLSRNNSGYQFILQSGNSDGVHLTWPLSAPSKKKMFVNFFFFFFLMFIFQRETQSRGGGGAERQRGRHRIWNRLQALSCQHRAQRRTHGLWDHDLSWSRTGNHVCQLHRWKNYSSYFATFMSFVVFSLWSIFSLLSLCLTSLSLLNPQPPYRPHVIHPLHEISPANAQNTASQNPITLSVSPDSALQWDVLYGFLAPHSLHLKWPKTRSRSFCNVFHILEFKNVALHFHVWNYSSATLIMMY